MTDYKLLTEQADQLRTRMQARVPIKGSLSFLDSRGTPHADGIDVGAEQSMKEPRSHIEGATPSAASGASASCPIRSRRRAGRRSARTAASPSRTFFCPNTIEWQLDRVYELAAQIEAAKRAKDQPNVPAASVRQLDAAIARNQAELERVRGRVRGPDANAPTISKAKAAQAGSRRQGRRRPQRLRQRGRRALLAADQGRDDLQRLSHDQGKDRRAGLRRDSRRSTPAPAAEVRGRRLSDQGVLHQPACSFPPRSWPARTARCGSRSAA